MSCWQQDNSFAVIFRLYFKRHCQTRMTMSKSLSKQSVILVWQWLWNRVEISPQNCCFVVNSSYLEFTRCSSSEYVFFLHFIKLSAGKGSRNIFLLKKCQQLQLKIVSSLTYQDSSRRGQVSLRKIRVWLHLRPVQFKAGLFMARNTRFDACAVEYDIRTGMTRSKKATNKHQCNSLQELSHA